MANLFQNNDLVVRVTLAVASLLFIGMGYALENQRSLKRHMSRFFPEDGLPVRHYSYRRAVGIIYMTSGLICSILVFVTINIETDILFPFWNLVAASANSIMATTVMLTLLYASRTAFCIMAAEAILLVALAVSTLVMPDTNVALQRMCMAYSVLLFIANIFIYIRIRKRYLRTLFGVIGEEALDYPQLYISLLYLPALLLSILISSSYFFMQSWILPLFILCTAGYYLGLGFYYRRQSYDSPVIEEAMDMDFDWKNASDKHWRKILDESYW